MNADEARDRARYALTTRLRAWGVPDPEVKARDYVAGLQVAGWIWMSAENRPRPPRRHEECEIHAGSYRGRCAGCAADDLARADEPDDLPPAPPIRGRRRDAAPKPKLPRRTDTEEN